MQAPALTTNPKTLAPNPIGGGTIAVIAIGAAIVGGAILLSRKKEEPEKPKINPPVLPPINPVIECPIDPARFATWAASKGLVGAYVPGITMAPPDLSALTTVIPGASGIAEGKLVIALGPGAAFFRYANGKPVAAPELRTDYCKAQQPQQPALPPAPAPISSRAQTSALNGYLHSPVFL